MILLIVEFVFTSADAQCNKSVPEYRKAAAAIQLFEQGGVKKKTI